MRWGQARGRLVGREELARVRLERHHAGHHATLARGAEQRGDHRLMAQVHAVEIADGEGNRARGAGRGMA
jgi:hypothetical protein